MLLTLARARTRLGAVALAALSSTCCDGAGVPYDAGLDASLDAGRDATRPDAPSADVARDATPDVGRDAPFPGDPQFVALPIPGVEDPADEVLRARHPERFPIEGWYSCVGSVPSCRQQRGPRPRVVRVFRTSLGLWAAFFGGGPEQSYDGIGPIEGPLAGLWQRPLRPAGLGGVSLGVHEPCASQGTAAFALDVSLGGSHEEWFYAAPLAEIGQAEDPLWRVDMAVEGRGAQHLQVDDGYLLADIQPDRSQYLFRFGEDGFQVIDRRTVPGIPENVTLLGGHVIWEAWASLDETRLVSGGWDRAERALVDVDPGDVKGFASDGVDLAWLQLYDRDLDTLDYARRELWTARYHPDATPFEPRLVDPDFPTRSTITNVGGGWFVIVNGPVDRPGHVELRPLHGGPVLRFDTPDGATINEVLYVDAENLIVRSGATRYWVDPRELPAL
jgi:hypothetical protein